jgi:hypothetical protein
VDDTRGETHTPWTNLWKPGGNLGEILPAQAPDLRKRRTHPVDTKLLPDRTVHPSAIWKMPAAGSRSCHERRRHAVIHTAMHR